MVRKGGGAYETAGRSVARLSYAPLKNGSLASSIVRFDVFYTILGEQKTFELVFQWASLY